MASQLYESFRNQLIQYLGDRPEKIPTSGAYTIVLCGEEMTVPFLEIGATRVMEQAPSSPVLAAEDFSAIRAGMDRIAADRAQATLAAETRRSIDGSAGGTSCTLPQGKIADDLANAAPWFPGS